MEDELRKSEERYRFIAENSTDVITILTGDGIAEFISPSVRQIVGYYPEEIIGKNLFDFVHPDDLDEGARLLSMAKDNAFDSAIINHRYLNNANNYIWFETTAKTIRNDQGDLEKIVAISRDISKRREQEEKLVKANELLQYLSTMDGLTGIPNRRHFEEDFQKEWQRCLRNQSPISVIMLDVDFFKKYNDEYGHLAGDDCLKTVARTLQMSLKRPGDFAARYGGEEFVVVLPETNERGALHVGNMLCKSILDLSIPHAKSDISEFVTISAGCATSIPSDSDPETLIQMADEALYKAKKTGRNRAVLSDVR